MCRFGAIFGLFCSGWAGAKGMSCFFYSSLILLRAALHSGVLITEKGLAPRHRRLGYSCRFCKTFLILCVNYGA